MNDHDDQPAFSALKFAEQELTSEQLEYITEFSDQVESLRYLSRTYKGPAPTLDQAIAILDAAPVVLQRRRRRRGGREVSDADREWHAELRSEILSARDRKGERLPAVLSRGEIAQFIDNSRPLRDNRDDQRDHLMLRVFYATGCRISEIAKFVVADLYLPELKVFVRDGKGDKDRYVLLDPETAELLAQFVAGLSPDAKVFDIGERQISRIVKALAERIGIPERYTAMGRNFSPHSLRHTCATHLYEAGMDLYMLKEILGHSSLATTREYIHIGINRLRNAYQDFHPLCQLKKDDD